MSKLQTWTIQIRHRRDLQKMNLPAKSLPIHTCYYACNGVNMWICDNDQLHLWRRLPVEMTTLKELKQYIRQRFRIVKISQGLPAPVQIKATKYSWLFVSPMSWFHHKGMTLLWMPME
jgi:hypothetical protein